MPERRGPGLAALAERHRGRLAGLRQPAGRRPAGRHPLRPERDHARRGLEPRRQRRWPYVPSRWRGRPTPIERLQASAFVSPDMPPMGQSFRLWRATVTVGELRATVARYLGEEQTAALLPGLRAPAAACRWSPARDADIHLLRYAEHLLASAIGAASSRARPVAAAAPAQRHQEGRAASCWTTPRRPSSTTATCCSTRSTTPARASRCSTTTCA